MFASLRIMIAEITLGVFLFSQVLPTFAVNPVVHELIQTHSATTGYSFTMSGTTYLAIGNADNAS
jgi:hypothetical protein